MTHSTGKLGGALGSKSRWMLFLASFALAFLGGLAIFLAGLNARARGPVATPTITVTPVPTGPSVQISPMDGGLGALMIVTGEGWQPGDELLGLTRALLYAGAASVLVTLWEIDSEAALELMVDFYERLYADQGQKRPTKISALYQSMNRVREQREEWNHPYYWAPFVLVGDWR